MGDYHGISCPICNQPLDNDTEVVVCPECGAPYHKQCISVQAGCIFDDLHQNHQVWQAPVAETVTEETAPKDTSNGEVQCEKCQTLNPVSCLFCEICGMPLHHSTQTKEKMSSHDKTQQDQQSPCTTVQQRTAFGFSKLSPEMMEHLTTPFAGLNPEDTIQDVKVKDLAMFVGQNASYFLSKFQLTVHKREIFTFNLAAAFFKGFYFFYRKMYSLGILIFIANLLLLMPRLLMQIDYMRVSFIGTGVERWFDERQLQEIGNVCSFISFGFSILLGIIFNRLYKTHCITKIHKIKKNTNSHDSYVMHLTKCGSVTIRGVMILIVINIAMTYLLMFLIFLLK